MAPPLRLLAAAAASASLIVPASASGAVQHAPSSAAFVDTIGVNVHSSFGNTPYDNHPRVVAALQDLGVRHVRDGLFPPGGAPSIVSRQKAFRAALADRGIRSLLIMGEPGRNPADYVAAVRDEGTRTLSGIEGPNEPDLSGVADWAAQARDYQRRLHAAAKAEPGLAGVPVLGPSLAHGNNAAALGNVGAWTDRANIHAYPGGRAPGTFDDGVAAIAQTVSGGQPAVVTETGYHNAMWQPGGHAPTSEAATAVYLPRLFLDNFRRGIPRTYSYELINAHHDPTNMSANYHFGLLRNDWSEKPVYSALKHLIRLVDPAPAATGGGSLDYGLQGDLRGISQVLLRRADGAYALAVWQTAPVWDAYGRRSLSPGPRSLRLNVAAPADVSTGRPRAGSGLTPVASGATAADLSVPGDDVLVVVIRPTGAPAPPAPPATDTGRDAATPAPAAPQPAPVTAPRTAAPSITEQWRRALANLRRKLGLRSEGQATAKPAAATRAKAKKKAKKAKAKQRGARAKARPRVA